MIPSKLTRLVEQQPGSIRRSNKLAVEAALAELGISLETELAEFFLNYTITFFQSNVSDEQLCDIAEPNSEVAVGTRFIQEVWGLPTRFVCLSSIQGGGAYLYDKESGGIWDFDLDNHHAFVSGRQSANWRSYFDFMHWYLSPVASIC